MIDNIRNRNLWIILNKIWKTNFLSFNNVSEMNYRESAFKLQWTWTVYKKFFYNTAIMTIWRNSRRGTQLGKFNWKRAISF